MRFISNGKRNGTITFNNQPKTPETPETPDCDGDDNDDDIDDDDGDHDYIDMGLNDNIIELDSIDLLPKYQMEGDHSGPVASNEVLRYNIRHPIPTSDPDVQRFQSRFANITRSLYHWAWSRDRKSRYIWRGLNQEHREMTRGMTSHLQATSARDIFDICMLAIPLRVQQILGSSNLTILGMLALEDISPNSISDWGVYINILLQFDISDVMQKPSTIRRKETARTIKKDRILVLLDLKVYFGLSIAKKGLKKRLYQHEMALNGNDASDSIHYGCSGQPNVISNFR